MGVAIGRPVRGPPAADSRIRSILLPVAQSPPSPLRGYSLDDALSSRCFKRWQLNKNCSGRPSFFPLPPCSTMTGEAFAKHQQTGHPTYFDSLARTDGLRMTHAHMIWKSAPNSACCRPRIVNWTSGCVGISSDEDRWPFGEREHRFWVQLVDWSNSRI